MWRYRRVVLVSVDCCSNWARIEGLKLDIYTSRAESRRWLRIHAMRSNGRDRASRQITKYRLIQIPCRSRRSIQTLQLETRTSLAYFPIEEKRIRSQRPRTPLPPPDSPSRDEQCWHSLNVAEPDPVSERNLVFSSAYKEQSYRRVAASLRTFDKARSNPDFTFEQIY